MKARKNIVPLLLTLPLLLGCSPLTKAMTYEEAQQACSKLFDDTFNTTRVKEFKFTYKIDKEYFDSVKHKHQTMVLTVDLNTYRAHLTDVNDDHNGSNLFQGEGEFWFWLDPEDSWAYHIAMVNDCDKNVHNVLRNGKSENQKLFKLKLELQTPHGDYGNPYDYTIKLLDNFIDVFESAVKDPATLKQAEFTVTQDKPGNLYIDNTNHFNKETNPKDEYKETYTITNGLISKETYHLQTEDFVCDETMTYELGDFDIKLPNPNLFK